MFRRKVPGASAVVIEEEDRSNGRRRGFPSQVTLTRLAPLAWFVRARFFGQSSSEASPQSK
jgi:hypothetical protein